MIIRMAVRADLDRCMEIYDIAQKFMVRNGNPRQWYDNGYPSRSLIEEDISKERLYVVEDSGTVHGVFMLESGPDETYLHIDGSWLNDEPYYVIHRVASSGKVKGILKAAVDFALRHCNNIKMDTYTDNTVMQKALEKLGFVHCGTIYVKTAISSLPMLAYQLKV